MFIVLEDKEFGVSMPAGATRVTKVVAIQDVDAPGRVLLQAYGGDTKLVFQLALMKHDLDAIRAMLS